MSSYTKVNPEELKTLASTIQKAKNNIDTCLTEYKNNLNKINEEGYLQGVANATISTAYSKLVALVEEFGNYGETVRTKLNEIATETEKIDESEGKKAEDVYSQDPLTFGVAAANAILGASASEQAAQVNEETTQVSSESTPYANVAYDEKRGYVIQTDTPVATGQKYDLTDEEIRYLAAVCKREQGSVSGAKMEASLMANLYESSRGKNYDSVTSYVKNSSWFGSRNVSTENVDQAYVDAVKDVLVDGNRYVASNIDEHDCISDITYASNNGVAISTSDRSAYIPGVTVIKNKYGSTYTFAGFAPNGGDPFGYIKG